MAASAQSAPAAAPAAPVTYKVFVGNLSFKTREPQLAQEFSVVGKVVSANIITRGPRSLGYGFVEFETEADANKAVQVMNKKQIDGREINVEVAKPREAAAPAPANGGGAAAPAAAPRRGGYRRYGRGRRRAPAAAAAAAPAPPGGAAPEAAAPAARGRYLSILRCYHSSCAYYSPILEYYSTSFAILPPPLPSPKQQLESNTSL